MIETITPAEMRQYELEMMQATGVSSETLMELAAKAVANAAEKWCKDDGTILCLCGPGNNGGDGIAALRILLQKYKTMQGVCVMLPGTRSVDCLREQEKATAIVADGRLVTISYEEWDCSEKYTMAIDALFGTGLSRKLQGVAADAVERLNSLQIPIVSVDIPSGINGQTGRVMGNAVCADVTVTFHRPKVGLYVCDGPDYAGEIVIADIGLTVPAENVHIPAGFHMADKKDIRQWLPPRKKTVHKGDCGKVLLLVGSAAMAGAAAICAKAALRTGAGLVKVACPEAIMPIVQVLCPCATYLPLSEDAEAAAEAIATEMNHSDSFACGCGMSTSSWAYSVLSRVLAVAAESGIPSVLDADALNIIAEKDGLVLPKECWITPHPGEAARLLKVDRNIISSDPVGAAKALREKYNTAVILKGAKSVLVSNRIALNPFGTPAMAKGGSGDALTGILAALVAGKHAGLYTMDSLELMQCACALHGLAGEQAEQVYGERGVLATDLCDYLGMDFSEEIQETRELVPQFAFQQKNTGDPIGRNVQVCVEKVAGSKEDGVRYPLNFGYVLQVLQEDNEWQDACVYGYNEPLEWFIGPVSAVVTYADRTLWVVTDKGTWIDKNELIRDL